MTDITSIRALEAWFEKQPRETLAAISTRAALRAFPLLTRNQDASQKRLQLVLMVTRAILSTAVVTRFPTPEIAAAAVEAADAFHRSGPQSPKEGELHDIGLPVARVAFYDFPKVVNEAADAAEGAISLRAGVILPEKLDDAFDDASIESGDLFSTPLWHEFGRLRGLEEALSGYPDLLRTDPDWSFWRDWYGGFLNGKPLDWELQRRVAVIPDEDWEEGPAHIAKLIEEIRARFELEKRIGELEVEVVSASASRHGIGGNNPPDPISDLRAIPKELTIIWAPLRELKDEAQAEEPNKSKLRKIIEALGTALKHGLQWCAKKADLAVDTAIKWAVPAIGGGYFAMNPDKLSAVIDAAKSWLSTLP